MMTFEKTVIDYCTYRGMFAEQAAEVLRAAQASELLASMKWRWADEASDYPKAVLIGTMLIVKRIAVEWIDANLPMAWFRPMFTSEAPQPEGPMPSNLPTVEGYDPNRRTTVHLTDEALERLRTLEAQRDELLAALERIVTYSRDADCGDHCSNACMYCQARAAIRKAKGEPQC